MFSTKIPSSLIPEEPTYIEKYIMDDIFKTLKTHKSKYNIDDKL